MSVTVTLDVFSGRPNPSWILEDEEALQLLDHIHSIEPRSPLKTPGSGGQLGYRGFSLHSTAVSPFGQLRLQVHQGIIDPGPGDLSLVDENLEIEKALLKSAGTRLDPAVAKHVEEALAGGSKVALEGRPLIVLPLPATCQPKAVDAPPYNPGKWNIPTVQPYNNCYNYANDLITNTFAQPGRAHGKMYKALACNGGPGVEPAAVADGLNAVANFNAHLAKGQGWYVALVIWPGVDYHWYRQDSNGCWSHKPGSTAARNVDNSGHIITDPKTCNRGSYTVFCTYMVTHRGVVIR
jgi:hypothetical protein